MSTVIVPIGILTIIICALFFSAFNFIFSYVLLEIGVSRFSAYHNMALPFWAHCLFVSREFIGGISIVVLVLLALVCISTVRTFKVSLPAVICIYIFSNFLFFLSILATAIPYLKTIV